MTAEASKWTFLFIKHEKLMTFARQLKTQRVKKKMTQHDLSVISGINVNQISSLERDNQLPGYTTIVNLCKSLKCQPNDLIEVKGKIMY